MSRYMLPTTTKAVVWRNVPLLANEPVAFIRIDDGYAGSDNINDDPAAAELVEGGLVVTPFINYYAASSGEGYPPTTSDPVKVAHWNYLKRFTTPARGAQNHGKQHVHLAGMTYTDQYNQINGGAAFLSNANAFGVRPRLFAPPYGEWDDNTLLAAKAAGFNVLMGWTHVPSDIAAGKPLRPGDVILLHFSFTLHDDLVNAAAALSAANLTPGILEDYLL
jgi:peptidoglycan/xylan/chitin deacetylase (PgdA/CDA1 family)